MFILMSFIGCMVNKSSSLRKCNELNLNHVLFIWLKPFKTCFDCGHTSLIQVKPMVIKGMSVRVNEIKAKIKHSFLPENLNLS